jgi:prepilin-type N-terminal cleavage/methylation domain-containing protein
MVKIIRNFKFVIRNSQKGMTLIELVVVLAIFAVLSGVAIFNYGGLQTKVDLTNLANDIALQVVQAQNSALNGLLPPTLYTLSDPSTWKPSYGAYFDMTTPKQFIYFVDLNSNHQFDGTDCSLECLSKYTITKGDFISDISAFYTDGSSASGLTNLTITFSRPNSGATLYSNGTDLTTNVSYVQITIISPREMTSFIKIYPSGRVQIN